MADDSPAPEPPPTPLESPPPRAFAQGTGVLLQVVGFTLFLLSCTICSATGIWEPVMDEGETVEAMRERGDIVITFRRMFDDPRMLGYTLMVMFTTAGGLALASLGIGLQADRRHAAAGATFTSVALLTVLLAAGVALWMGTGGWIYRLMHLVLTLVIAVVVAFCIAAWREVRRHPPPAHVEVVAPGTKIPYNFYHDDPPDVRLAKELAQRRARLEAEQAELERLERELRDREGD